MSQPFDAALLFVCVGHMVRPRVIRRMLCFYFPVVTEVDVQAWSGSWLSGVGRIHMEINRDNDIIYDAVRL